MAEPTLPPFPAALRAPEQMAGEAYDLRDYGRLDELLVETDRRGVLDVPAEDEESARHGEANRVREPVVADRLRLLGYLAPRAQRGLREHPDEREAITEAARRFQAGAGLVADGWVGEKTWRALQELVTFETPTRVGAYCDGEQPRPALLRAVRLRLRALGFLERDPTGAATAERLPLPALRAFWRILERLHMVEAGAPLPSLPSLLERLFDQRALVDGLARSTGRRGGLHKRRIFVFRVDPSEQADPVKEQVRRFIVCLTRIELWLLDFDLDISRPVDHRVFDLNPRGVFVPRDAKLHDALGVLHDTFREHIPIKRSWFVGHVTPELITLLADPPAEGSVAERARIGSDHSFEVSEQLHQPDEVRKAWAEGRSLGARLWDGLGRVWRWIRRGVQRILKIGRNLFRAFYRYALEAFGIVRFAARNVAAAVSQYLAGEVRAGQGEEVRVRVQGDGDFVVVVTPRTDPERIAAAGRAVTYFAQAFRFSTRLLATLMRTLRSAASSAGAGLLGWARLLWVLVRSYTDLRPLYRELRDLETRLGATRLYEAQAAGVRSST